MGSDHKVPPEAPDARPTREDYEALLEVSGAMVQVVSPADLRYLYVNRAWKTVLGYSDADLAHLTVPDVVGADNAARVRERLMREGEGDDAWEIATELIARDGRRISVEGSGSVQRVGGRAVSARAILRDVSARKRVEAELRASEATYRTLARNLPNGAVLLFDRDLRYVVADGEELLATIGLSKANVEGRLVRDVVSPANRETAERAYRATLAGSVQNVEYERNGRAFALHTVPVRDERGAIVAGISLSYDITERRAAEREVGHARAQLRGIVEHALDAVITVDAHGAIEASNPAAEKIFGVASADLVGRSVATVFPDDAKAADEPPLALGLRETVGLRGDGARVPIELAVSEVPLEGRRIYTLLARDITERKEVDRLKSEFVAVVSHELRTPLTSIRGSLGLLEGGVVGELPGPARELVTIARSNTDRLIRLINEILDLEKLEAGKIDLRVEPLDAAELVNATLEGLRGLADGTSIALTARVAPLPALVGDRDRLIQVLTNLVSNAIKFSPPDSTVLVAAERVASGCVRFTVTDHGPGIAAEHLPRLFGRFEQVEASDRRARGGTGLGLAISKAIVEQHGGRVGVESRVGVGSAFWFELAVAPTIPPPRGPSAESAPVVLLVEDDDELADALGPLLAGEGYEFARAATIAAAEAWMAVRAPALVLMDVGLPDGNGLDLAERIHTDAASARVPIIVLSGRERVRGAFANPRVLDWLAKPFDHARLLRAVRHAVRRVGAPRALVVDDDAAARTVLVTLLKSLGVEPIEAVGGAQALALARETALDLIVLDVLMPPPDGFAVVETLRREGRAPALLVYTVLDLSAAQRAALTLGRTVHLTRSRTSEDQLRAAVRALLDGVAAHEA